MSAPQAGCWYGLSTIEKNDEQLRLNWKVYSRVSVHDAHVIMHSRHVASFRTFLYSLEQRPKMAGSIFVALRLKPGRAWRISRQRCSSVSQHLVDSGTEAYRSVEPKNHWNAVLVVHRKSSSYWAAVLPAGLVNKQNYHLCTHKERHAIYEQVLHETKITIRYRF